MKEFNPTILLVEDDPSLGFVIKDNLEEHQLNVKWVKDGVEGFENFFKDTFDLCILDVMLPKKDGFTLAKEIRMLNEDVPIIFLTAKSQTEDKIKGFNLGGDDYLTKPFEMEELLLRIEAIFKRTKKKTLTEGPNRKDEFEIGAYHFNFKNLELSLEDEVKVLTRKEAELLRLLCIHRESVLQREMALKVIWGKEDYFLGRSMDVFISKLRKYLQKDPNIQINNIHGVGFKLTVQNA